MPSRPSLTFLAALLAGLTLAACGGDDEQSSTTDVSESASAAVVLPASEVSAEDGAQAHSEAPIRECSSMDADGDVGSAAFGGFQDVSVAGMSCETGRERILAVDKTYDGESVDAQVDGFDCAIIDRLGGGLNTIRCHTADGESAFRYTVVPVRKKRVELVVECGTFGRFYDVSARGQECETVATFLDNTPTAELTAIPQGEQTTVGGETCTTLYVEGRSRTVRCTQDGKAMRFSIATKPSADHPRKWVENPQESSDVVEKTTQTTKPAAKHGLSPNVVISCNATGPFDAITARGIGCATVTALLTQNADQLEGVQPGSPIKIGTPAAYTCDNVSKGDQTATVQCSTRAGTSFRASFIPASASPPADGNPPATTTADAAAAQADDAPTDTTTTTSPDDPVSSDADPSGGE